MITARAHVEDIWDRLAKGAFVEAELRSVNLGAATFRVLYWSRSEEFVPALYLETGLSLLAWPRLVSYRHRWVLLPRDTIAARECWRLQLDDVVDALRWSAHMEHISTFSTFKSGASEPFSRHWQSFPLRRSKGEYLTALRNVPTKVHVERGAMPRFEQIEVAVLQEYPACGLKIVAEDSEGGLLQAARKTYELALGFDALKSFNVVIVPDGSRTPSIFLFPRRKDGKVIFGPHRWQIAGLELNGLLQAPSKDEADKIDEAFIIDMFGQTTASAGEFEYVLSLIDTF